MHTARRTFVATGTVALLAAAGVTAAIAADPAPPPPPRIAFVANGIVPADALAAGPIAGQLGAPIYTTQPDTLSPAAATGLDDHDPELVIVLGGPVAIHDTVIDQVEDATGLSESADATPAGGIVRAAGGDRFDTAAAVADLLAAYNPAYLPIDMQAIDADTVDGKHASDFQPAGDYLAADGKAADAAHADSADTAANADGLGGHAASEYWRFPITLTQPLTPHPYATESDLTFHRFAGTTRLQPTAVGGRQVLLDIPGTIRRDGTRLAQPTEIEFCYHVDDPADAFTSADIWSGNSHQLENYSSLGWNATTDGSCETLELSEFTAGTSDSSIGLVLTYDTTGTGTAHHAFIDGVAVTYDVTSAAASTAAAPSATSGARQTTD